MVICCYGVQKLTSFLVLVLQLVKLRFQVSFTLNVKVTLCITKNSLVMPVLLFFYHSIWLRFHSLVSVVPVTWCTRAWVSIYYPNKEFCKVTFYSTQQPWLNITLYGVTRSLVLRIWWAPDINEGALFKTVKLTLSCTCSLFFDLLAFHYWKLRYFSVLPTCRVLCSAHLEYTDMHHCIEMTTFVGMENGYDTTYVLLKKAKEVLRKMIRYFCKG